MANIHKEREALTLADIAILFPKGETKLMKIWQRPKWIALYYTMLTTGMRQGEAAALQCKHIVWDKYGLLIMQAVKTNGGIGTTKSRNTRACIIPSRTMTILIWWHSITPFPDDEHFTFYGKWGTRPIFPGIITYKFQDCLQNAQFTFSGRIITVHCLRHTYNTRIERVLPGEILRYMIGHRSEATTQRYLHKGQEEHLAELLPE